jgi:hypothetical protein
MSLSWGEQGAAPVLVILRAQRRQRPRLQPIPTLCDVVIILSVRGGGDAHQNMAVAVAVVTTGKLGLDRPEHAPEVLLRHQ